jgi:hypothetical protein
MSLVAWLLVAAVAQTPADADAKKKEGEGRPRKLDLGPYGAPTGGKPEVEELTDIPRFESTIEVEGKAPADFNQTMSVWWAHFNIPLGAVYGRGTAFRAPPPQGSVDVTPLVSLVSKKVSDYKRNRRARPKPDASPSPGASPSPDATPLPEPSPTPKP